MSLVIFPCHRCGSELSGHPEHTKTDCDEQVEANRIAGEAFRAANERHKQHLADLRAKGLPLPPTLQLPPTRVVKVGGS